MLLHACAPLVVSIAMMIPNVPAMVDAQEDLEKMQGTWEAATEQGQVFTFTFENEALTIEIGNITLECGVELNAEEEPAQIDVGIDEGPDEIVGAQVPGIYKLEDGRLVLCLSNPEVGERPEDFESIEGIQLLFELEKVSD